MCDEEEPKDEEAGDIKIENPVLSNYYLDFSHSFDQHFEGCDNMSPSTPTSITSEPRLPPPGNLTHLPAAPPDPRLLDPAHDSSMSSATSENTVVPAAAAIENTESWSNTFESNYTDTSVDEPKYAKVTHKKRNSKICSGNSTPKPKRRKPSEPRLSRENSSKFDHNSIQVNTSSPAIINQGMALDTERAIQVNTVEQIEDTAFDRTITDKSADIQDASKDANDSLQQVVTSLYANILVIFGLVLPLTTVRSQEDQRHAEIFYIFLFLGSLIFLIFVYLDLLHTKTRVVVKNHRKKRSLLTVKESIGDSGRSSKSSSSAGRVKKESTLLPGLPSDLLHNVDSFNSLLPRPSAHYGAFFIRLGTVFFGIGSLIYIGIEMGGLFEVGFLNNHLSTCGDMFNILRPTLHIVFIFFQMYFIFLNHKMNIYKRKFVTRLGLMHMIATNICVWLKVLVTEANHQILNLNNFRERNARDVENISYVDVNVNEIDLNYDLVNETFTIAGDDIVDEDEHPYTCDNQIIYKLQQDSSPYLYPCLVQFSLICSVVLLTMWKRVQPEHEYYKLARLKISHYQDRYDYASTCHRYSVDCNGSNTGLFCGVMVIIATIVSWIVFFVFIENQDQSLQTLAVQFASFSELGLYGVTSIAVMIGMCQMRKLWYDVSRRLLLDTSLLVTGQAGVFIYATFSGLSSFLQLQTCLVPLLASLTILLQTILQTAFIIDASHRFASTSSHIRHKPGRQVVTFLLVCNLAMWVVNILQTNKISASSKQVEYFDQTWLWPVVSHISIPLAIFYRFHSASCLYEIWKKSFKYKPANIDYI